MKTGDVKLSKVFGIMVGVTDLARSLAFYRDALGVVVRGEVPGEFAFLDGGGITLALSVPHGKLGEQIAGGTEIVFAVEGVREAYETLRARGVKFINEPRIVDGTNYGANFTDPDGHRLSIFGPERAK